jgi:hypothetical protein
MANREMLVSTVVEMAHFQVLVMEPPPIEDPTGLRGQLGITGVLSRSTKAARHTERVIVRRSGAV